MAYFSSPRKSFKCSSCEIIEIVDIREDERGLLDKMECTNCGGLMSRFSDPNSSPIEEDDIENSLPQDKL